MKKNYLIFIIPSLCYSALILLMWSLSIEHWCCDGEKLYYLLWTMIISNVAINILSFIYCLIGEDGKSEKNTKQ